MCHKQDRTATHIKTKEKNKRLSNRLFRLLAILLCALFFIFIIPILINESYKSNTGYITIWGAEEVLSFYSVILSGLITIVALIATIYYSKKDTEQQIRFAQSQAHTPFFVIDFICNLNDKEVYIKSSNGLKWEKEYVINHYKDVDKKIQISLKNIGDGIAIAPQYCINSKFNSSNNIPSVIGKNNELILDYDLSYILADINNNTFESFVTNVTINYQNILGINFKQNLTLNHILNLQKNTLIISINSISAQTIEYE